MQGRKARSRAGAPMASILVGLLAGRARNGAASTGGSDAQGGSCGTVAQKTEPGGSADLSSLPAAIRAGYNGYFQPVNNSVYAKFPAEPGPYRIGYSDCFSANSWRSNALARPKADTAAYQSAGLVCGLQATNSNLDNNLQIQQISSSHTAFTGVIKQGYDAGIPLITLASHVSCTYAAPPAHGPAQHAAGEQPRRRGRARRQIVQCRHGAGRGPRPEAGRDSRRRGLLHRPAARRVLPGSLAKHTEGACLAAPGSLRRPVTPPALKWKGFHR
jgi:hypothetical protein